MQLPKRHKSSWVSLLALATLACSAKSPASLGSLTQNHLLFPLAGLKNWLVRRRSHRVDEQLVASCTRKRLDDDPPSTDRVTVQLFQWRYSDVGDECEAFLGPNGYRYVQVSPPHEHIEGPQWWTDYQPVSYRIGSKRGSEAEFDRMVQRCGGAGVGVIVDVVLNHMSAGSTTEYRRGSSGSSYRKYEYPDTPPLVEFTSSRPRTILSECFCSHSQIFVTNWDLERNEHGIRIDKDPGAYLLCQVFILTWGYGQVDVFSGYHFSAYDDGPQDPVAQCGRFGWRCEHRHPMVVGAIQLGAAASDQPVHNIITSGAHRLAFSRGSKVFVAINNDDSAWVLRDVVVGLPLPASPEDAYRDRLHPAGEGQLVHLQPDPSSGLARLCPLTIAPRSAIGIMVV
ncbi:hypothetical protein PGT21_030091 [Puccinia graminis f. sp. tritici]|uniref:alpha-amylase n=1 Tax=Puccinia graminis f. sp. tritici TaxID=56615 RepID=A0A5B0QBN2_PUCGR|nr:hypothetical protein PGT21_030091 [Puccinia graminis f. sp. tritici]